MIVIEDEAKTKRCCEAWPAGVRPFSNDLSLAAAIGDDRFCIGSACMAWRWHGWSNGNDVYYSENNPIASHPDFKRFGYCGKAGAP